MVRWILGRIVVLFCALAASQALAVERVVGANATLDINAGARSAALGGASMSISVTVGLRISLRTILYIT